MTNDLIMCIMIINRRRRNIPSRLNIKLLTVIGKVEGIRFTRDVESNGF